MVCTNEAPPLVFDDCRDWGRFRPTSFEVGKLLPALTSQDQRCHLFDEETLSLSCCESGEATGGGSLLR
ncbi:conserved hypothetical protein [Ricinus communis]|uniref:Uncharacterized protein n=1 Tax=Ricinus communis TaxID=3988 RepID=B9SUY1_RICCO|nr:conserved hypothetical protein [Ricinus communis]